MLSPDLFEQGLRVFLIVSGCIMVARFHFDRSDSFWTHTHTCLSPTMQNPKQRQKRQRTLASEDSEVSEQQEEPENEYERQVWPVHPFILPWRPVPGPSHLKLHNHFCCQPLCISIWHVTWNYTQRLLPTWSPLPCMCLPGEKK